MGGGGLLRVWVWIFHTWTFRSGTNHVVHRQNPSGQNDGVQTPVKIAGGRQNAGHFIGQEGQNANLIKTLIISY